jgi:4-hydroxythreonine-4-phosphate dehydrogenase
VAAPIVLTMGEPAGIGGEIAVAAWRRRAEAPVLPPFFVLDAPERLEALAPDVPIREIASADAALAVFDEALPVLRHDLPHAVIPGRPNPANTSAVLTAIERGVDLCRSGAAAAMVTNPIHKGVLYEGGFRHPGHTEYLAELAGVRRTVMMLVGGGLRTVPVTVHHSLREAIASLTSEMIVETCRIVDQDLRRWFGLAVPRLAAAGLNPHAGENGALGREEIDILGPALATLRDDGIAISGPLSADTMFHAEARADCDAAICMYHDQALIPVKTLDFHGGVNMTLGLPFLRVSPDHGTAFGLAGTGRARPDSLIAALRLAGAAARRRNGS